MKAATYFDDFLAAIRLPDKLREKAQKAHTELRALLQSDDELKPIVVTTFLQGSYRRHTGVKPAPQDKADVDVVVVTRIDRARTTPPQALDKFKPFLEKHYKGQYRPQGRSWGITVGDIDIDLVPTSSPSETMASFLSEASKVSFLEELGEYGSDLQRLRKLRESASGGKWRSDVLWIPDREAKVWRETNPIAQIEWMIDKNDRTNGHYVNVVKTVKWWRRNAYDAKHPKGYPLEHITGANCPDGIDCVAEGFLRSCESIVQAYKTYRQTGAVPSLQDHGVSSHNVLARLTPKEFAEFYDEVTAVSREARRAFDEPDLEKSVALWRGIFGAEFPEPPKYSERTAVTSVVPGRFA
jgi:hypothetical protein